MLQAIVDRAAQLLATPRVSLRLLDPSHTRLVTTCRAGGSFHHNATSVYRLGEGLVGWIAQNAASLRLGQPEDDPRFVRRPDQVEKMGSYLGLPLLAGRTCIGVLSAINSEHDYFTAHHQEVLELLAGLCAPYVEVARLSRLSQIDALTGAFNRRGLDVTLPPSPLVQRSICVAMADIDHFKRVNDTHGHAVGDEVLRRVARILSKTLRGEDSVVRYGGEEFLLILHGVELRTALKVSERARAAIERSTIAVEGKELKVTMSFGVTQQGPTEPREETIERADAAMYAAKRAGRNRVASA
jgi:diguanylate cyclase (GGDEF)-like protein